MQLFAEAEYGWAQAAAAAKLPAQGAVLAKTAGKVLRVAGLIHRLVMVATDESSTLVNTDTLLRAIDLVVHLNEWVVGLHVDLASGEGATGIMRKVHDTATKLGEPLSWTKFRATMTKSQKNKWDRAAFCQATGALVLLGVGQLVDNSYMATGTLP
jgi:hypothetical protein